MTESTEILSAKKDPIYDLLGNYKAAIQNVLPKHITPERVLRVAYTVINRNHKLQACTKASLINAVLEMSMLGLDLGRTAHIVPYKTEATFIPDYKGYIDLAHRSGQIDSFPFKPVYENDDFEYQEGTNRYINHKPCRGEDRGKLIAAYAIAFFKHGGYDFEVVEKPDIEAVKKMSPGAKYPDSPWNKPDQEWTMWCKTAVRRLAKRIPQSPELQRVAYLEELAEAGLRQEINHVDIPIEADFKVAKEKTQDQAENLKEKLKSEKEKSDETNFWLEYSNWNRKKEAGFSTCVHEHIDELKLCGDDTISEVRDHWYKLYPDDKFPLNEPDIIDEEDSPENETDKTDKFTDKSVHVTPGLEFNEMVKSLNAIKSADATAFLHGKRSAQITKKVENCTPEELKKLDQAIKDYYQNQVDNEGKLE